MAALPEGAIVTAEGKDYIFVVTTQSDLEKYENRPTGTNEDSSEHNRSQSGAEQHGMSFKQIPVRRGVTEGSYSQVTLPARFDLAKTRVVVKGAFAVLSQLKGGGEEE